MGLVRQVVTFRANGNPQSGLTVTWRHLKKISDGTDITPQPSVTELANGQYTVALDPEINGEAAGQLDGGSGLDLGDRYIDVIFALDSSRAIDSAAGGGALQADAAADATSLTLPTGLSIQQGSLLYFFTGDGSPVTLTVESYDSGTGATVVSEATPVALNGTASDSTRSRFMVLPAPVPAQLPLVNANGEVQLDPSTELDQINALHNFDPDNDEVRANVVKVNDDANAAARMALAALGIISGQFTGTPTSTSLPTDRTETEDDFFAEATVVVVSGDAAGQRGEISAYVGSTKTLTVPPLEKVPAAGDFFVIV